MQSTAEAEELERLRLRAKSRRQPLILITVFNLLIIAVGFTAVADQRRLQTASGTGMRWLQAALYGDCTDYLTYSMPDPSRPDSRTRDEFCQDLRVASMVAQADAARVGKKLSVISPNRVQVQLIRKGVTRTVVMHLVQRDGKWRVLRDEVTCNSVGCA